VIQYLIETIGGLNKPVFFRRSFKIISFAKIAIVFRVGSLQSFGLVNCFVERAVGSIRNCPDFSAGERVDVFQGSVGQSAIHIFEFGHEVHSIYY
jgi:hypothetical protein